MRLDKKKYVQNPISLERLKIDSPQVTDPRYREIVPSIVARASAGLTIFRPGYYTKGGKNRYDKPEAGGKRKRLHPKLFRHYRYSTDGPRRKGNGE